MLMECANNGDADDHLEYEYICIPYMSRLHLCSHETITTMTLALSNTGEQDVLSTLCYRRHSPQYLVIPSKQCANVRRSSTATNTKEQREQAPEGKTKSSMTSAGSAAADPPNPFH